MLSVSLSFLKKGKGFIIWGLITIVFVVLCCNHSAFLKGHLQGKKPFAAKHLSKDKIQYFLPKLL